MAEEAKEGDFSALPPVQDTRRGRQLGVSVAFLKQIERLCDPAWQTRDVVYNFIKPQTDKYHCRFADLGQVRAKGVVGDATVFVSHCWGANFRNLVAAVSHHLSDETIVWVDIFAINQWKEAQDPSELDFGAVVQGCSTFILVLQHLEKLSKIPKQLAINHMAEVCEDERRKCAFYRVWCLVELAAALKNHLPVLLMVGSCGQDNKFVHDASLLGPLYHLVNIGEADASHKEDIPMILDDMLPTIIGASDRADAVDKVNSMARGALHAAGQLNANPEVLHAVLGNPALLLALPNRNDKILMAASAGYYDVVELMLEAKVDINQPYPHWGDAIKVEYALHEAARCGQTRIIHQLMAHGANVNAVGSTGTTALEMAALDGHTATVEALLQHKADVHHVAQTQKIWGRSFNALQLAQAGHAADQRRLVEILRTAMAT